MGYVTPIIIPRRMEPDCSWYRFAAILCFLEAYYCSMVDGSWPFRVSRLISEGLPREPDLTWITTLVRPAAFVAAGVALWSWHRSSGVFFGLALATCLADIAATCQHCWRFRAYVFVGGGSSDITYAVGRLSEPIMEQLPWLVLAVLGYLFQRQSRRTVLSGRSTWVACAAIWLAMQAAQAAAIPVGGAFASTMLPLPRRLYWLEHFATAAILATGAVSLVQRWRCVRPLLIVFALLAAFGGLCDDLQLYDYTFMTDGLEGVGRWFCICMPSWVLMCGQWVLIAAFAFRIPMWQEVDDGSPYPHLHCGRCHYNLHGISSQRCPECGTDSALVDSTEPPHATSAGIVCARS